MTLYHMQGWSGLGRLGPKSDIILYLVSYGILCYSGDFSYDTAYEQVYKYYHPNLQFRNEILTNIWYIWHRDNYVLKYCHE
jgi:hypothetical protein